MAHPIQIAAQLLECRDAHKRFFGETFLAVTKDYRDLIQRVADQRKENPLNVALAVAEQMDLAGKSKGIPLLIAAVVELIEPSEGPCTT